MQQIEQTQTAQVSKISKGKQHSSNAKTGVRKIVTFRQIACFRRDEQGRVWRYLHFYILRGSFAERGV